MINDNLKKINQILEIVKIMQQERSGAFLVLLSIDTDIPPVDCRFLFSFFFFFSRFCFSGVWFCLFFICFLFLLCPFCLFYFLFLFIPFFL
jgi:hypothetical protein